MSKRAMIMVMGGMILVCVSEGYTQQRHLTLVRDGRPRAQIVLPDQPDELEQLAADELQHFIERMSGTRLVVTTDDNADRTRMRILLGDPARRVIPAKLLDLALGERRDALSCRNGFVIDSGGGYLAICGVEPSGTLFGSYELLERLGCRWFWPGEIGQFVPQTATVQIERLHVLSVPSFDRRSMWFSRDNELGEPAQTWSRRNRLLYGRSTDAGHDSHPWGVSDEAAGKKANELLERLRKNPRIPWFSLSWGDTNANVSEDQGHGVRHPWNRRLYQAVDALLGYYNGIAARVVREYPHVLFGFLVYNDYFYVPLVEDIHPNLSPWITPMGPCARHVAGTGTCWHRDAVFGVLKRWCALSDKVFVYDYEPSFINVSHGVPVPAVTRHRVEMPMIAEMGVRGILQQSMMSLMQQGPNLYIRAKLMWDAHADVDVLLNDYYAKLYGPAAGPARRYWDALEQMMHTGPAHAGRENIKVIYPIDTVRKLAQHIEDAESAVDTDTLRLRVRLLRWSYDNLMLYLRTRQAEDDGRFTDAADLVEQQIALHKEIDNVNTFFCRVGDLDRNHEDHPHMIGGILHDNRVRAELVDGTRGQLVAMLPETWQFRLDRWDQGIIEAWFETPMDSRRWKPIRTTRYWEAQGYSDEQGHGYDGIAWYRTEVSVSEEFAGRPIKLNFDGVRKRMWIWVNGKFAGRRNDTEISKLIAPGKVNTVTVRVENPFGPGGIYRRVLAWSPTSNE